MKPRFTDEQIIAMIKEQEAGGKIADVCRRYGISQGTFYKYKSKVWRHGAIGRQEAAGAGSGERQAAQAAGRTESRHAMLREECLNETLFSSLTEAREMLET